MFSTLVSVGPTLPSAPVAPIPSPVRAPSPISVPTTPVRAPTPVSTPVRAPAPVAVPIRAPVTSPVRAPAISPINQSGSSTGCCSHDFKTCINWCGSTRSECLACRTDVTWLSSGSRQSLKCSARWGSCNNRGQKCCAGLVCKRQNAWYSQCTTP
jgi:hypothetical protein